MRGTAGLSGNYQRLNNDCTSSSHIASWDCWLWVLHSSSSQATVPECGQWVYASYDPWMLSVSVRKSRSLNTVSECTQVTVPEYSQWVYASHDSWMPSVSLRKPRSLNTVSEYASHDPWIPSVTVRRNIWRHYARTHARNSLHVRKHSLISYFTIKDGS
jgi:hypothetical protein